MNEFRYVKYDHILRAPYRYTRAAVIEAISNMKGPDHWETLSLIKGCQTTDLIKCLTPTELADLDLMPNVREDSWNHFNENKLTEDELMERQQRCLLEVGFMMALGMRSKKCELEYASYTMRLVERQLLDEWVKPFPVKLLTTKNKLLRSWLKFKDNHNWCRYSKMGDSLSLGPTLSFQVYAQHATVDLFQEGGRRIRHVKFLKWSGQ